MPIRCSDAGRQVAEEAGKKSRREMMAAQSENAPSFPLSIGKGGAAI